ncbi:CoA transferase [Prauserella flavalba]|uniref:CoA transferase n=1 Tax=Prauserella flavalba TaxID=1477506 RepID=UPI0036E757F4
MIACLPAAQHARLRGTSSANPPTAPSAAAQVGVLTPKSRGGVPIVDMVTGTLSFSGILLALQERQRSGRGQRVGSALLERGVRSSPVHDVGGALTDPQVLHREMVVELDGYRGVGVPVKLGFGEDHLAAPRDRPPAVALSAADSQGVAGTAVVPAAWS